MAISAAHFQGATLLDRHERVIHNLEQATGLNRDHEVLPDAAVIAERWVGGARLTRPADSHCAPLAKSGLHEELSAQQRALAEAALSSGGLDSWQDSHRAAVRRLRSAHADLATADRSDVAILSVAVQALRDLVHASVVNQG